MKRGQGTRRCSRGEEEESRKRQKKIGRRGSREKEE